MSLRIAEQWASRARELAGLAFRLFVNRTDVRGGYRTLGQRGQPFTRHDGTVGTYGRSTTHKTRRRKPAITCRALVDHFAASDDPSRVVGVHSTSPDNTSIWAAIDIDRHEPEGGADPAVNLAAAFHWLAKLRSLGFRALLVDSNGDGGYHLWVFFRDAIPTPDVHAFAHWLVSDHAEHGFADPPETFPKQPTVDASRPYGNWLRIPGRHHTRDHWARVWDNDREQWLEGAAAADCLLTYSGDDPGLIPDEARGYVPAAHGASFVHHGGLGGSSFSLPAGVDPSTAIARATRYVERLPIAVQGKQGSRDLLRAACRLVLGFGLPIADARPILAQYSDRCSPPWSPAEIDHVLESADKRGGPRGYLLDREAPPRPPRWHAEIADVADLEVAAWCPNGELRVELLPRRSAPIASGPVSPSMSRAVLAVTIATLPASITDRIPGIVADLSASTPAMQAAADIIAIEKQAEAIAAEIAAAAATEQRDPFRQQELCPRMLPIVQRRMDDPKAMRVLAAPCNKSNCAACIAAVRLKWRETVHIRLGDESVPQALYVIDCPAAMFASLTRRIRRRGGRYYGPQRGADGFLVSTVQINGKGANRVECKAIAKAEAVAFLHRIIDNSRSSGQGSPLLRHSQGWGWLTEEKGPPIYETIGVAPSGYDAMERVRRVLDSSGVAAERKEARSMWSRHLYSLNVKVPAWWGERRRADLLASLGLGEAIDSDEIGGIDEWMGGNESGGGDGHDDGSNDGESWSDVDVTETPGGVLEFSFQ